MTQGEKSCIINFVCVSIDMDGDTQLAETFSVLILLVPGVEEAWSQVLYVHGPRNLLYTTAIHCIRVLCFDTSELTTSARLEHQN